MRKKLRFIGFIALGYFAIHLGIAPSGDFAISSAYGPGAVPVEMDRPFTFAVLGDTHAFRGNMRAVALDAATRGCRFVIQLGDFVDYDDAFEYRDFAYRLNPESLPIPVHLTRGNHETMATVGGFSDNFARHVVPTYRIFEFGGALFCMLDNSDGQFAPPQLTTCDERIRAFREQRPDGAVLLFMHMPPGTADRSSPDLLESESMRLRLFTQRWKPAAIFAGHVHDHYETALGDTRVIVSGCGGGSLRAPSTDTHYLEVTIDGGRAGVESIPFEGEGRAIATLRYAVNVLALRYRRQCLAATLLLAIVWGLRARRRARSAPRVDSAGTRPDSLPRDEFA
ncbi:MAG TPA: metallophosphoesterase [Phycisphaerae bacterium]|nr:metallophosphoesterase [Phycisphaerae bacterium]HRW55064.1 metallophosphoesterase [Phycisphaerae bacterium]